MVRKTGVLRIPGRIFCRVRSSVVMADAEGQGLRSADREQ
jgi:hypothetical protein